MEEKLKRLIVIETLKFNILLNVICDITHSDKQTIQDSVDRIFEEADFDIVGENVEAIDWDKVLNRGG